jgi:hypothetical protein
MFTENNFFDFIGNILLGSSIFGVGKEDIPSFFYKNEKNTFSFFLAVLLLVDDSSKK